MFDILLADDSEVDVDFTRLALLQSEVKHNLHVVDDGDQALAFLRREADYADAPRPHLVLLDKKMNMMDGHDVLDAMKADEDLRSIPVVIVTTSNDPQHVLMSYQKYAASHITKPMAFNELVTKVADGLNNYWFNVVRQRSRLHA